MEKRGLDHQDRTLLLSVAEQVEAMGWPREADRLRLLAEDSDPRGARELRGILAGLVGLGGSLGKDVDYLMSQTDSVLRLLRGTLDRNVVPQMPEDELNALVASIAERLDRMGLGAIARHLTDGCDLSTCGDSAALNDCLRTALDEVRCLHWERLGPELRDDIERVTENMSSVARPNK